MGGRIAAFALAVAMASAAWGMFAPGSAEAQTTNLVAHWDFDDGTGGVLRDASGNGNDGVLNSCTWVNGVSGGALMFDGADDYITVPDSDTLDFGTGSFTVLGWIKTTTYQADRFIDKDIPGVGNPAFWSQFDTTGKLSFTLGDTSHDAGVSMTESINDNVWHHVAFVRDSAAGMLRAYLDGTLQNQAAASVGSVTNTEPLYIGGDMQGGSPTGLFSGYLDDIYLYSTALTATEISASYQTSISGSTAFMSAYWNFDEGSGALLHEQTGSGYIGTVTGATWTGGIFGNALSFDGTNDYVTTASSSGLSLGASEFSVEVWFRSNHNSNGKIRILSKGEESHSTGWDVNILNRKFGMQAQDASSTMEGFYSQSQVTDNSWHYGVIVAKFGGYGRVYIDGALETQAQFNVSSSVGNGLNLVIGYSPTYNQEYYRGELDEVRIHTRALSLAEISAAYARATGADEDLIANWSFNEGMGTALYDLSPKGNDGTVYGASWAPGAAGGALSFDGVDDYADCGRDTSLNVTGEITIEAWVNCSGKPATHLHQMIAAKWGSSTSYSYALFLNQDLRPVFTIGWGSDLVGITPVQTGRWVYIAGVFSEATNEYKIFIDGSVSNSLTNSGYLHTSNEPLFIGSDTEAPTAQEPKHNFNGLIDEVRVQRKALTPAEISANYHAIMDPAQAVTAPSAPTGLAAVPADGRISLSWSAPMSDGGSAVTGYNVYRRAESGDMTLLASLGNVLGYNDTDVEGGVTYQYNVTAVNAAGEGPASASAAVQAEEDAGSNAMLALLAVVAAAAAVLAIILLRRRKKPKPHSPQPYEPLQPQQPAQELHEPPPPPDQYPPPQGR